MWGGLHVCACACFHSGVAASGVAGCVAVWVAVHASSVSHLVLRSHIRPVSDKCGVVQRAACYAAALAAVGEGVVRHQPQLGSPFAEHVLWCMPPMVLAWTCAPSRSNLHTLSQTVMFLWLTSKARSHTERARLKSFCCSSHVAYCGHQHTLSEAKDCAPHAPSKQSRIGVMWGGGRAP